MHNVSCRRSPWSRRHRTRSATKVTEAPTIVPNRASNGADQLTTRVYVPHRLDSDQRVSRCQAVDGRWRIAPARAGRGGVHRDASSEIRTDRGDHCGASGAPRRRSRAREQASGTRSIENVDVGPTVESGDLGATANEPLKHCCFAQTLFRLNRFSLTDLDSAM